MRRGRGDALRAKRYVLGGYAAWIALLIVVYYQMSDRRIEAWGLIVLSGVAAVLTGVMLNRPARKVPWLLLAAALACFGAGQLSFLIAAELRVILPFPSFADLLYLSEYPLAAAGLLIFIKWRTQDGDRRSAIDALTLTVGLALLSWTFLIRPYVHNPALSGLQKSVAIAYPLGDVLMLALLARLLAPGSVRTRCVQFLTLGAVASLVSDTAFGVIQLHGTFHNGSIVDLGWALFYSAWGAAALHPSMARLTEPVSRQQVEVSPVRLAVLMLASLIAPVVLLANVPREEAADVSVVAVFSAVLYLLVLTRLWDAARSHRRALDRERVLRQAGLALVTTADVPQVAGAVQDAVGALLGGHAQGAALLGVRIDGTLRAVDRGTDPVPDQQAGQLTESWLRALLMLPKRVANRFTPEGRGGRIRQLLPDGPTSRELIEQGRGGPRPDSAAPVLAHHKKFGDVVRFSGKDQGKAGQRTRYPEQERLAVRVSPVLVEVPVQVLSVRIDVTAVEFGEIVVIQLK